jgi:hypothetical protein
MIPPRPQCSPHKSSAHAWATGRPTRGVVNWGALSNSRVALRSQQLKYIRAWLLTYISQPECMSEGGCRKEACVHITGFRPLQLHASADVWMSRASVAAYRLLQVREKAIADQFEARRAKNKASRERKLARREERLTAVSDTADGGGAGGCVLGGGVMLEVQVVFCWEGWVGCIKGGRASIIRACPCNQLQPHPHVSICQLSTISCTVLQPLGGRLYDSCGVVTGLWVSRQLCAVTLTVNACACDMLLSHAGRSPGAAARCRPARRCPRQGCTQGL